MGAVTQDSGLSTQDCLLRLSFGDLLARLLVLLLVSIVGLPTLWQVIYGVSLGAGVAVVGETCVFVALAFVCAWRWTR